MPPTRQARRPRVERRSPFPATLIPSKLRSPKPIAELLRRPRLDERLAGERTDGFTVRLSARLLALVSVDVVAQTLGYQHLCEFCVGAIGSVSETGRSMRA